MHSLFPLLDDLKLVPVIKFVDRLQRDVVKLSKGNLGRVRRYTLAGTGLTEKSLSPSMSLCFMRSTMFFPSSSLRICSSFILNHARPNLKKTSRPS